MAEIKAEKMATRQAYGKTLVELGKTTPHLVVMDADLSKSTMTAEFGNSGSVFYEPPAGFDKVYYYDEGSFGLKFYLEAPSGAGQLSCYGYNSVYSTLSSGGVMSWEADLSSFTERRHTAPDGTELTILSNGSDAYIYVYLEDSFFAMHVYGAEDMSDADVDYAADAINYSNIGR